MLRKTITACDSPEKALHTFGLKPMVVQALAVFHLSEA
jgi:hypothetical protein